MYLVGEVALDGAAGEGVVLDGDAVAVEIVGPYLIGEDDGAVRAVVSRRRVAAGGAFDDRPRTVATAADASSRNPGVVPGKPIVLLANADLELQRGAALDRDVLVEGHPHANPFADRIGTVAHRRGEDVDGLDAGLRRLPLRRPPDGSRRSGGAYLVVEA